MSSSSKILTQPVTLPFPLVRDAGEADHLFIPHLIGPLVDELQYRPNIVRILLILVLRMSSCRHQVRESHVAYSRENLERE